MPVGTCTQPKAGDLGQYVKTAPTLSSDVVCADYQLQCTPCSASQYISKAGDANTCEECAELTQCTTAQYAVSPPGKTVDRVCADLTICAPGAEYETLAPSPTSDRHCQGLSLCTDEQYIQADGSSTSDRVCAALTVCSAQQYETSPSSPTSDRECADAGTCANGDLIALSQRTMPNHCGSCKPGYILNNLAGTAPRWTLRGRIPPPPPVTKAPTLTA